MKLSKKFLNDYIDLTDIDLLRVWVNGGETEASLSSVVLYW